MGSLCGGRDKVVKHLLDKGADFTHKSEYQEELRDAYSLSKKESCCSIVGFWQRAEKILGTADFDNTHSILNSYQKKMKTFYDINHYANFSSLFFII